MARQPKQQVSNQQTHNLNELEIDSINDLSLDELIDLRNKIDSFISSKVNALGKSDVIVDFNIVVRTFDDTFVYKGNLPLINLLKKSSLSIAPMHLHGQLDSCIWRPIRTDFFELLNNKINDTGNEIPENTLTTDTTYTNYNVVGAVGG